MAAPQSKLFTRTDAANLGVFSFGDWLLFVSIALIWGSSFLLIAVGLEAVPPAVVTLARVGLGALALSLWPAPPVQFEAQDRLRIIVLSLLWVGLPFTFFPLAQQHINSALTGLLNGSTPIFVAIVSVLLLRQVPKGAQLAGIAVGFVGVVLISLPSLTEGDSQWQGVVLVLAATACYGLAINIAPPLQQRYGSVALMARVLSFGTLWVAPWGVWELGSTEFAVGPWLAVAVLGIICTGAAFAIMASLVGSVGSTRASFITYVIPVVALLLGVTFRDDDVAPLSIIGVVFVLGGAFLASRRANA